MRAIEDDASCNLDSAGAGKKDRLLFDEYGEPKTVSDVLFNIHVVHEGRGLQDDASECKDFQTMIDCFSAKEKFCDCTCEDMHEADEVEKKCVDDDDNAFPKQTISESLDMMVVRRNSTCTDDYAVKNTCK